jgi:hypothetical protein
MAGAPMRAAVTARPAGAAAGAAMVGAVPADAATVDAEPSYPGPVQHRTESRWKAVSRLTNTVR